MDDTVMSPAAKVATKVDAKLAADEDRFQDDPERHEMLQCVRRFKASWIDLGRALSEIRRASSWKRWGFDSFEAYTKSELHLRQETVDKLTGSFMFLQKRAPNLAAGREADAPMPSYQAIDFLRRAEEREDAPKDAVRAIYTRVMEEGANLPALKKEFQDSVFPLNAAEKRARDASGIRNVATRLRALVDGTHAVPKHLASRVAEALDELLAAVGDSEAA
jgi:hypothetical protein